MELELGQYQTRNVELNVGLILMQKFLETYV